ncbi:hypothetical protein B0H14DRAFT_3473602 [Mycena olivaceomarginata]|nr:hypothetical protein B0H14DRAFT_3473602 [Mycena olivaceomarginata]
MDAEVWLWRTDRCSGKINGRLIALILRGRQDKISFCGNLHGLAFSTILAASTIFPTRRPAASPRVRSDSRAAESFAYDGAPPAFRSRLRLSFLAAYTVSSLLLSVLPAPMKLCTYLHLLSFYFPAASPKSASNSTTSRAPRSTDVGTPKVLSLSFLPMPCHADRFVHSSYSTLFCSRSAALRSCARWADKDGDTDGDREGRGGGKLLEDPLPAIFALHIATHILSERTGKPLANPLAIQNRRKLYGRMLRDLQAREAERAGTLVGLLSIHAHMHTPGAPPLDEDDVALLFEDVHRGRSVVPPPAVPVKPTLVRWDSARALGVENVVVMNAGEAGV